MLNIAESGNRRALVTHAPNYKGVVSGKSLEYLCKRRLIEVEVKVAKNARLDLSLTGPAGRFIIQAKNEQDMKRRFDKMRCRGWEEGEDQSRERI